MLRISYYATASTDSAAYIIGGETYSDGYEYVSTIGEYKNNKWTKFGDLSKARKYSSAIFHNGEYIIVGGRVLVEGKSVIDSNKVLGFNSHAAKNFKNNQFYVIIFFADASLNPRWN